jgi:hypothetical protein
VKQIVEKSKPAIVRIEAEHERIGTGFAINPQGVIATNLHVVAGASEIQVRTLDGSTYEVKRILGFDLDRDLALLALDLEKPMPSLPIGDSELVSAGDPVVAIGNPLGVLDYTVSDGLISSVRVLSDQLTVLQISAPISQGSSGGPLFNPYGEVIGLATAIFAGGQNLNFAVPSKYLSALIQDEKPMTLDAFADATTAAGEPHDPEVKIERNVPMYDISILAGCTQDQMAEAAQAITEAIEVGAPLYNEGKHGACFRIYEGAALKLEKSSGCAGIRTAFRAGIDRAASVTSDTEKAWAMRDTFDGLMDVMIRKTAATP